MNANKKGCNYITFIGEVLVDYIYDKNNQKKRYFGGSPANIAMNLSKMGFTNIYLFSSIGNDDDAHFIEQSLIKQNLSILNINKIVGETSTVTIKQTIGTPVPKFKRFADYHIEYTKSLETAIKHSKILHFSYWPLSMSPAKETVIKAINYAKKNDVLIAFDPNFHEALSSDKYSDLKFILSLLDKVDFMKPSLDDAQRLFGEGFSNEEYLNKFLNLGVKNVVLSLGKDGMIAKINDKFFELESMASKVIDATGAGDAFYSGFYAGILKNESIEEALKLGVKCSALALTVIGGQIPINSYTELKKQLGDRT